MTGSSAVPVFTQSKSPNVLDTCRNFKYLRGQNLPGAVQALPGAAMARLTLPRAPAAVRQTRAGGGTVPEGAPGAERAPVGHQ